MCVASWNLLNIIKIGLSMIGIAWFLVTRLRSINFNLMVTLGVGWGTSDGKPWLQVYHASQSIQYGGGAILCKIFFCNFCDTWLHVALVTCARQRARWHKLYILAFFKMGPRRQFNGTVSTLLILYFNRIIYWTCCKISEAMVVNAKWMHLLGLLNHLT
jgi:hypothetical protein